MMLFVTVTLISPGALAVSVEAKLTGPGPSVNAASLVYLDKSEGV
jgi:hypothetical protein